MVDPLKKKSQLVTKEHFDKSIKKLREEFNKKLEVQFDEYDKKMDVRFDESYKVMGKRFDAFQKYLEFRLDPIEQAQKDNEKFKQSVLKSLDWLVGAFKKFDEEHIILSEGYSDVREKIEDHENRIVRIENTA